MTLHVGVGRTERNEIATSADEDDADSAVHSCGLSDGMMLTRVINHNSAADSDRQRRRRLAAAASSNSTMMML